MTRDRHLLRLAKPFGISIVDDREFPFANSGRCRSERSRSDNAGPDTAAPGLPALPCEDLWQFKPARQKYHAAKDR